MLKRLLLLLAVGLFAACGSDDTGGTIVGDTTNAGGDRLTIERVDTKETATLSCEGGEATEGTGWLSDPAAAQAACELLVDESVLARLIDGPPPDQMCTQIYGGPEEAIVTGTLDARFGERPLPPDRRLRDRGLGALRGADRPARPVESATSYPKVRT